MIQLVHGDNLEAMAELEPESVSLAYLDPPFFTGKVHRFDDGAAAFDDRWENLSAYLSALGERVRAVRRLLAPHGCMVLHLDPRTSHHAKLLCDEIFGAECFASEVIWRYRRWPSRTRNFQRVHDVMLRYVKDPAGGWRFNQLHEPLAESTRAAWGSKKQRAVMKDGRRVRSSVTEYESPGVPLGDVWDIGIIAPVSKERTGYPTQKPERLLERWILACTDPGDLVLDPYCGSGTTLAVASRLGRRAVGIDSGDEAIATASERLNRVQKT